MIGKLFTVAAFLLCLSPTLGAAGAPPDQLVETTVNQLIEELEERRGELEQDKGKLYKMVEDVVVPHFELPVIARLVLARHWREASESQRSAFANAFKKLLIRTYATALFEYTGKEKMDVKPARIKDGEKRARVETEVTLPGAPPVPVNYSFLLNGDGEWKIYDVDIDGISLVTNYRSSYGEFIRTKGLDALIEELEKKNASLKNA
jgi:phospholipid transport system substrate-binding protein